MIFLSSINKGDSIPVFKSPESIGKKTMTTKKTNHHLQEENKGTGGTTKCNKNKHIQKRTI